MYNFTNGSTLRTVVRLLQGDRRPDTVKSYDQKWLKFETFTSQAQDDAGAPRMFALPVSSQTVVAYLGYLLEAGTISAKSLQSYLSVINTVHNDFEYPPPSCGHLVKLSRKGFAELQGSVILQPHQVTVFPPEHMFDIVQFGLRPDSSKNHIRVCLSVFSIRLLQPHRLRCPSVSYQRSSVRFYPLHQSILQECRQKSGSTLLQSIVSSRRSTQLFQQDPDVLVNSVCPS